MNKKFIHDFKDLETLREEIRSNYINLHLECMELLNKISINNEKMKKLDSILLNMFHS